MTSIAGPMTFEQYSKNPPKQNGYLGDYQRTGDVQQDYQNYRNQTGFDLYRGMQGDQDAYDRYNAQHGTNYGNPGGGSPLDLPDMTTYGNSSQQQGSGFAGFDMGEWLRANGFAGYEQPKQQQPEQQQFANLTMAPDSTPQQVEEASRNWMNWMQNNSPQNQGGQTKKGGTKEDDSRTIMPGETSEDSPAVTDFANSNVEGAPSGQTDEITEEQLASLFPENFNIEEMMKRVPGTEDMSLEDFITTFDPRARIEGMPAPEGVAETEYGDGIVRTQSFDQYLQPKSDPAFGADVNSLGNMGNNIFDVRRPAAFESSFPDPFGRANNPTTYSSGMQGVMENQSHETAFATLLGSMQQQQAENMRGKGLAGYMPIDVQALYDYAGTPEGQELAAETFANDQMKFNKIMGY